jgi:hypothetical protein
MPDYKYPNIESGATPIEIAGRAPDRLTILRKNLTRRRRSGRNLSKEKKRREEKKKKKFEPMIDYKFPTIASGATPIGSAGRAPDEELLREGRGRKI